jgi:hypothetical protein
LAQQRAWIDAFIAKRQQAIDTYATRAAADAKLTAGQTSDIAGRLAKRWVTLNTLKAAVDSATSTDGLHQAIKTALASDDVHGYFGWCGFYGSSRHDPAWAHTMTRGSSTHHPKAKADPAKATPPSSTVHTVAVRSGQSSAQASKQTHTVRHSDSRRADNRSDYRGRHTP